MKAKCCRIGCEADADVRIEANTDDFEDYTDACLPDVGELLGTIGEAKWGTYTLTVVPVEMAYAKKAGMHESVTH